MRLSMRSPAARRRSGPRRLSGPARPPIQARVE